MVRHWHLLVSLVVLSCAVAGCGGKSTLEPSAIPVTALTTSTPGAATSSVSTSMAPSQWSFRYSPSMPSSPSPADVGWQFEFPTRNGVHYLTTSQHPASASASISAAIEIDTNGQPYFEYRTEANNTCDSPATVRLFFQRRGDDMSGNGAFEFYRWWSRSVAYVLNTGSIVLTGDLSDPSQWTSVFGKSGDTNEPLFRAALADLGEVGFTFGGGCFYGHGVFVTPNTGGAVFKAKEYVIR